jgi:hypothetical protein
MNVRDDRRANDSDLVGTHDFHVLEGHTEPCESAQLV